MIHFHNTKGAFADFSISMAYALLNEEAISVMKELELLISFVQSVSEDEDARDHKWAKELMERNGKKANECTPCKLEDYFENT